VARWRDQHGTGNIALRLAGVDPDHEVTAIDVDDYLKGEKKKNGGAQLKAIEQEIECELPPTWVSTSRTDGASGKRFYRVPRGLRFRGKAADDIEIIQKRHRFAVVWPSYNPDSQAIETWFPPGAPLTLEGRGAWDGVVPDARSLPLLPDAWIDFLTQGRVKESDDPTDMDSSLQDLYDWAYATLGLDEPLCYRMKEKVQRHIRLIREEATSHDKLTNAHMNIFHLAREGHRGWDSAALIVEKVFTQVCSERDKRSVEELRGEIFRSRVNGLRKIKGFADRCAEINAIAVHVPCDCDESNLSAGWSQ
jgi:hypothetical protein